MALFDGFFKSFSSQQKKVPGGFFSFLSPLAMPRMGEKDFQLAYHGWVYTCSNAIAERIADIDLSLERRKGKDWQKVESHPALDLLHDVNPFTSFYEHVYLYELFQQLNGNSFWYIDRNGNGNPAEIWQLNPTQVQIVKDKDTYIKGYTYTPSNSNPIPLEIEEVLHFKRPNPNDDYRGMGTVQAAAISIDTDKYASEWQRNFFGNAALPSGILSTEGTLTDEQFTRLKMQWDAKYKGVANSHKMAIMEAGMKFQSMTPSAREMEFTNSRKDIRDEILAIFRVPKPVLGILEDVNLASAAAVKELFAENVVKPRMTFFITKLNEFYLPMWKMNPTQFRFNFTDPVPQNIELELKIISSGRGEGGTNPWMTINEARARFKYEPVENGDELERSTMDTTIEDSDQPDDAEHTQRDEEEEQHVEEGEKSAMPDGRQVKKKVAKAKPIERTAASKQQEQEYKQEQIAKLHDIYLKLNTKLEKELVKRAKKQKAVKAEIPKQETYLKHLERLLKDGEKVGQSDEMVNWIFENDMFSGWVTAVYNASEDGLSQSVEQAGRATFADLNMEGSFDLKNPRAVSFIKDNALRDSNSYSNTIKESITERIVAGVDQGLSNEKIADSIAEFFTEKSDYQAMRMARYETMTGYGAGNLEGYKQSGVVDKKYWIADAEACPICTENAEAGEIGLDEEFPSGDQHPENHPNGECSLGGTTATEA